MTAEIEHLTTKRAKQLVAQLALRPLDQRAMDWCIYMSLDMWAGFIDERMAAIWGLIPPTLLSTQAYLWLWTTDVIKDHQFILIRHSQLVMEKMLKDYPSIVGHAVVGNDKAIRWLKWLGAKFGEPCGNAIPFRIRRHG